MAETISMPKLGFDMAEGLLVRWVKQVGETINKGDVLAEIETDKATVEVESSASGVVLQLIVDQGTMVPVNAPIAVVGKVGEVISNQSSVSSDQSSVTSFRDLRGDPNLGGFRACISFAFHLQSAHQNYQTIELSN